MQKISVIIPTFNRGATLERAICSVLNQTYAPYELFIVDDGSDDETHIILEKYKEQLLVIKQSNHGVSHARNQAIAEAKGDWLAFLDSDDEWLPKKLAKQVEAMKEFPHLKIFHTDEIWIRKGKRVNACKHHQKYGGWIYEKCLPLCAMSPSSIIIHRSVFEKVGVFDEDLPVCEDYDLWLRITHRYPVGYIDEMLIKKYGGHKDQLSTAFWGNDRYRVKALIKALENLDLDPSLREKTLDMLFKKLHILEMGCRKHGRYDDANRYALLREKYCEN